MTGPGWGWLGVKAFPVLAVVVAPCLLPSVKQLKLPTESGECHGFGASFSHHPTRPRVDTGPLGMADNLLKKL